MPSRAHSCSTTSTTPSSKLASIAIAPALALAFRLFGVFAIIDAIWDV
jgi:hypothetical protein